MVEPDAAHLAGRVLTSFVMGNRTRLVVDGVGSGPLIMDTADRREFTPGQTIHLALDPDALQVLDR